MRVTFDGEDAGTTRTHVLEVIDTFDENTFYDAVRVSDTGGGGGLHSGEYGLEPISWKDKVHLTVVNADTFRVEAVWIDGRLVHSDR